MQSKRTTGTSLGDQAREDRGQRAFLEKRREYNRRYMRAWRADPAHQALDRDNRDRSNYERKLRDARIDRIPYTNERGERVCGLCRRQAPVTEIVRLQVCDCAPQGYVEIRIPYCGEC
ncbi:MAG: hypothetical protein LAN36_15640 [Acidobacteriia bacterium]|nr:hypothetical protein [Terriglobia bacterium]